ncbi:MAG: DUF4375 domain-containing protein [Patescibacteria group bacterium]
MTINEILKIEDVTKKVIALHQFCSSQKKMTGTEKIINSLEDFENDVMNGGFDQYLINKSAEEHVNDFNK